FPPIGEGDDGDEATVMRPSLDDDADLAAAEDRPTPAPGALFSNNAAPIRSSLPTEEEGDALLDQLLADPGLTPDESSVGAAADAAVHSTPPPLPEEFVAPEDVSPDEAHFSPISDDDGPEEPTRMLSAMMSAEQVILDLQGRKVASEAPPPVEKAEDEAPAAPESSAPRSTEMAPVSERVEAPPAETPRISIPARAAPTGDFFD